ncbi:molecular chaperone GrpE [Anoxybacillus vitaminiphilus]|uniref:Protein GrpE n=1 Tax=Paranoxybacillus vitaminiphilus TaxID=581036 RepID=A0A327YRU6_9BACL|nr:nucleotide exchange factor GrpE [Anoxybacillus vitaminiphilus]RAK22445.1 molecular chaperone GrpE [Anoxybacillus vitaminiphilus]
MEKELQQEEVATYKSEEATAEAAEASEQTEPEQVSEQPESEQISEQMEENSELTAAKKRIAELEEKLQELENRYLRLHADFDNFRRRTRLDFEAAEKYRAQSLVTDILPALDNFERALKVKAEDDKTKSILQGMEMVYRSLMDALKKEGVEVIEAVGKPFDPHLHQAVMQVEDSSYEPNTVVEEFQKGYKLKDRVIRPSMVKVSQ